MDKYLKLSKEYPELTKTQLQNKLDKLQADLATGHQTEIAELLHELQVHQIELEMQNRELREAQENFQNAYDRYLNLYDYAPVGYVTFDSNGCIIEINLTGAAMLGCERENLIGKALTYWLINGSSRDFLNHLRSVTDANLSSNILNTSTPQHLNTSTPRTIELEIKSRNHEPRYIQLESITTEPLSQELSQSGLSQSGLSQLGLCRSVIIDITRRKKAENELVRSQVHYQSLFESSPLAQWEDDFSAVKNYFDSLRAKGIHNFSAYFKKNPSALVHCGRLVQVKNVNKATLELFGFPNKAAFLNNIESIFTEESLSDFGYELASLADGATHFSVETRLRTAMDDIVYVIFSVSVVTGYEESLEKVLIAITDVTHTRLAEIALRHAHDKLELRVEQRTNELTTTNETLVKEMAVRALAETKLSASEEKYRRLFSQVNEGIIILNTDNQIIAVNKAFTAITGFEGQEALGKELTFVRSDQHDGEFARQMSVHLNQLGHWQHESWNRRKNGEIYPVWENISAVKDDDGRLVNYVAVFSDISSIKLAEERLAHLAHHDPLTGLPNRLLFQGRLEQSLDRARRHKQKVALLFLDLDRFKMINDTLGHAFGDQLLVAVANRLKDCVRAEDTVARLGGDEFTLLMTDINRLEDVTTMAEKILAAVVRPLKIGKKEIVVTTSIGISLFPEDADCTEDLTKAADVAMYRAKARGRHTYDLYTRELTALAFERMSIEQGIREALANNQFKLLYQPQFDLKSGKCVGVEALLRWHHPEKGIIFPETFIPIAEECGLIMDIDEWTLQTGCAQAAAWRSEGCQPVHLAINQSGRNIMYDGFAKKVQKALADHQLPASSIELEVTESVLQTGANSIKELRALKRIGVGLSIDDFGTGYSSLSSLKELPIDKLKIDRSFITDLPDSKNDSGIAKAIIALGHNLNLKVIAEGVETDRQWAFLRDAGCDEAQGYRFSKPLSAAMMGPLLRNAYRKQLV